MNVKKRSTDLGQAEVLAIGGNRNSRSMHMFSSSAKFTGNDAKGFAGGALKMADYQV